MLQYWRVYLLLLVAMGFGGVRLYGLWSNAGYMPEQPIPFSHVLHANVLKIDCLYCHGSAERAAHATVPPMNTCMGCHSVVKRESPYIQKLTAAYESGEPIEWVRIHRLPDHSHFSHQWHVAAGISCQECHGPVQEMEKVYQVQKLEMKACMDCHRQANFVLGVHHPPTFQGGFAENLTSGEIDSLRSKDPEAWRAMEIASLEYVFPGESADPSEIAVNLLFQRDQYYHGRGYQLRNKNASVECTICHH